MERQLSGTGPTYTYPLEPGARLSTTRCAPYTVQVNAIVAETSQKVECQPHKKSFAEP